MTVDIRVFAILMGMDVRETQVRCPHTATPTQRRAMDRAATDLERIRCEIASDRVRKSK